MPKGWFPGTSSDSSWTKSVPWPSPKRSAPNLHLPPFCTSHSEAVRVSRRLPRICDNASSWGCQCMDLQGQNILRSLWDVSSMREFRTLTCRIGPLLEVDLTKKESLADPKFAILAESYVCSSHPQLKWTKGLFASKIYKWFHCWRYDFKGVCAVDCPQICCILLQRMLSLICTPWEWFRRIRFLQQHSISFCSCNKDAPSSP